MTNDERNPKPECRRALRRPIVGFVIRISVFLRISSFITGDDGGCGLGTQDHLPLHFSPSAKVTSCKVTVSFLVAAGTLNARQSTIPVVSPPTRLAAVKLE